MTMLQTAPSPAAAFDRLIEQKRQRIEHLRQRAEQEIQALQEARAEFLASVRGDEGESPTGSKAAVLELLEAEGGVHTSAQVAEMLHRKVISKSGDPRRVILSTISTLVREHVVDRDELGRLSLAKEAALAH